MLFFFHLFTGIVIGLLLGDILHDHRWVIPFALGAVLPDLIDKPIGNLFFSGVFGNGRIFLHSLPLFCLLLVMGMVVWKYWAHPAVLAVALGIFSHQVLDLMWQDPTDWFFPFLGPFRYSQGGDYAFALVQFDFSSLSEWILIIVIITAIVLWLAVRRDREIISRYRKIWAGLLTAGALVSCAIAGIAIGTGLLPPNLIQASPFMIFEWGMPEYCLIGGIVFALCAYLLWRLKSNLMKDEKSHSEQ
jgi:membrane-bound metal-dependent hydrolase YbcI (DUF457 family)